MVRLFQVLQKWNQKGKKMKQKVVDKDIIMWRAPRLSLSLLLPLVTSLCRMSVMASIDGADWISLI